jgi:peptide/nickel transport system substrate-binding protein
MPGTTRRRTLLAPVALGLAALLPASCAGAAGAGGASTASTGAAAGAEGGSFVYVSDVEPTCYDTGSFRNLSNYNVAAQILDPLVAQAPDGSYHPGLAASWTTSDDALVWTFTLRDDVVFHDGEKLTAQAVEASVRRAIALRDQGWYSSSRAVDDLTWEVTLSAPYAPLLQAFSNPNFPILSLASQEEYTDADRCTDPTTIVGTGPFVVSSYTPGTGLTLTRNDDYDWAPEFREHQGPAYLSTVEIRFIPEEQSRLGTLSSGQADAAASISPADLDTLLAQDGFASASAPSTGIPFTAVLNTASGPTADLEVREALRAAVDVQTIVDTVYAGHYARAWTALAPTTAPAGSYDEDLEGSYDYDPDLANALLDEAGWTERDADGYRTKDGQRLTLDWIVDSSDVRDQRDVVVQAFQADARKVGIEIRIEQLDSNTYGERGGAGEYSIVAESWGQSDAFLLGLLVTPAAAPPNGLNYSRVTDEADGELAATAASSSDDAERADLYRQIQQIQVEQVHNIPIYVQDFLVATTDAVTGISFNPTGWPDAFYDVQVAG